MNGLLQFALSNAIVAALATVVVVGVTRVWRSPHLAHLLWALVLLKLVTPPVLNVALPVFSAAPLPSESAKPATDAPAAAIIGDGETAAAGAGGEAVSAAELSTRSAEGRLADDSGKPGGARPAWASRFATERLMSFDWPAALALVWAGGTVIWLGVLAVGVLRFHRRVRGLPAAPEAWQKEVAALAARVERRAWPSVRLADGAISPLLWPIGTRPVIVLPRALVERLDTDGQRALLAHELAHYYRRDHWIRWFEMSVLAVYWWNPVAWFARRGLRAAEERCCDAWAIWLLGGNARGYGLTLLETINFLAESRVMSPMPASGMGTSNSLKGRFEMILHRAVEHRASWRTRLAGVAVAVAILPFSLTVVQVIAQPDSPTARPSGGWARLSPFTAVRLVGRDGADVEFEGKFYGLVSIDGLSTEVILDAARKSYGNLWEKRFVEDLVEVMGQMGHRPGNTVKLVLRDPKTGETKTVDRAPMTAENRAKAYAARYAFSDDDEKQIRQLVGRFAEAVEKPDLDALAKTLRPHSTGEGRDLAYFSDKTKGLAAGSHINVVRTIVQLPYNHALAVTDFFAPKDSGAGQENPKCVVYHCVRREGGWLIEEVDLVDVGGLVGVLRDAPRTALAGATD